MMWGVAVLLAALWSLFIGAVGGALLVRQFYSVPKVVYQSSRMHRVPEAYELHEVPVWLEEKIIWIMRRHDYRVLWARRANSTVQMIFVRNNA